MLISCLSCVGKSTGQAERRNDMKSMKEIYLAGGCFWGTEHFLKQIEGVEVTQVGYANGNIANPTYQQVCTGITDFAETVKVQYDSDKVTLPFLIDLYFKTIDPTSLNRQGNDRVLSIAQAFIIPMQPICLLSVKPLAVWLPTTPARWKWKLSR